MWKLCPFVVVLMSPLIFLPPLPFFQVQEKSLSPLHSLYQGLHTIALVHQSDHVKLVWTLGSIRHLEYVKTVDILTVFFIRWIDIHQN
jgi:hypothetical protein